MMWVDYVIFWNKHWAMFLNCTCCQQRYLRSFPSFDRKNGSGRDSAPHKDAEKMGGFVAQAITVRSVACGNVKPRL